MTVKKQPLVIDQALADAEVPALVLDEIPTTPSDDDADSAVGSPPVSVGGVAITDVAGSEDSPEGGRAEILLKFPMHIVRPKWSTVPLDELEFELRGWPGVKLPAVLDLSREEMVLYLCMLNSANSLQEANTITVQDVWAQSEAIRSNALRDIEERIDD